MHGEALQSAGNASANNIYGPINYNGYGANNNTNINYKNEINNGIKDLEDIKDYDTFKKQQIYCLI